MGLLQRTHEARQGRAVCARSSRSLTARASAYAGGRGKGGIGRSCGDASRDGGVDFREKKPSRAGPFALANRPCGVFFRCGNTAFLKKMEAAEFRSWRRS